ncbi:metal-dependent hydrolase [Bizionia sp. KMM 8389]
MDSLTQIVLGAAVGEAVLGRKIGNKAMLYGAIAGTIPDLDVIASYFTDTVSALEIHRGFTHSILFSVVFSFVFGWIVSKYETYKDRKGWTKLFFWAFITHPILDAHTTWGTQLFWPFDIRLAFKTIFVVDPLYTVPFLICLLLAMFQKRESSKRQFYNKLGLLISICYLSLTFLLKYLAVTAFEKALTEQHIAYIKMDTRPSAFNTILWNANIETTDSYLLGSYSFFDTQPITFKSYPKNHELINAIKNDDKMKRMIAVSKGWYIINTKKDALFFNDLRFGLMELEPGKERYVFQYLIEENLETNSLEFKEVPKDKFNPKMLLSNLWNRIKGN